MNRIFGLLALTLSLAACGQGRDETAQDASKSITPITPGTYSNAISEGEAEGWQVTLAQGEVSATAEIARCAPECADPAEVAVRIGMGGLMADYSDAGGRTITLAIRPHGDGIEVAADWGEGMESHKLVRVGEDANKNKGIEVKLDP